MANSTPRRDPAARRKTIRRIVWIVLALGLVALIVVAMLPDPVVVDVAPAVRQDLVVTVDEDGRTRVRDRYVVAAPITGNLLRLGLRAGDPVTEGAVVARILPLASPLLDPRTRAEAEGRLQAAIAARRQAQTSVERARTALAFAREEAERQRRLLERGAASAQVVSRVELDERLRAEELAAAELSLRIAEHEVEVARIATGQTPSRGQRDQMEVTSPIAGIVLRLQRESEGAVQAGTPLLDVGDPSALEIVVDVLTSQAIEIRPGAKVTIERWGGPQALSGHVRRVEPSAFTRVSALGIEEQRVNVIIDIDDPREQWEVLGDGYRVETRIEVFRGENVLTVPASAAFRWDEGWAVYVVADGHAARRSIEVGRRTGFAVQVAKGLREGELVVVHPSDRITEGARVEGRTR